MNCKSSWALYFLSAIVCFWIFFWTLNNWILLLQMCQNNRIGSLRMFLNFNCNQCTIVICTIMHKSWSFFFVIEGSFFYNILKKLNHIELTQKNTPLSQYWFYKWHQSSQYLKKYVFLWFLYDWYIFHLLQRICILCQSSIYEGSVFYSWWFGCTN